MTTLEILKRARDEAFQTLLASEELKSLTFKAWQLADTRVQAELSKMTANTLNTVSKEAS